MKLARLKHKILLSQSIIENGSAVEKDVSCSDEFDHRILKLVCIKLPLSKITLLIVHSARDAVKGHIHRESK